MSADLLHELFPSLDRSKAKIERLSLTGRTPDEECFVLSYDLTSSKSGEVEEFDLGQVGGEEAKVIRLTRDKLFWLFPHPDSSLPSHLDTQLLLIKSSGSKYTAVLPLTTSEYMGTLRGKEGQIVARFERDASSGGEGKVLVCRDLDLRTAVAGVAEMMRMVRGWGDGIMDCIVEGVRGMIVGNCMHATIFSDTLTYCTWNSLFPVPRTAISILRTLDSFKSHHIYPTTLLIDDAWQSIHSHEGQPVLRLTAFEAWDRFMDGHPGGMKALVEKVKEEYGIERVGAWHTISGYWQGVEPTAFSKTYKLAKVTLGEYPGPGEAPGFQYYVPHPDDVRRFFDDYYRFMSSCGVTFTKCDNVASLDGLVHAQEVAWVGTGEEVLAEVIDLPTLRRMAKQAVKEAAEKWFGGAEEGRVIWCMEMSPRVLLGKEVGGSVGNKMICRNSDDYYPDIMDSHRYHIYANVLNGIFTSQMNIIPDLDMFQTHAYIPDEVDGSNFSTTGTSAQAAYHAALRALAHGPVTLTDVAGHTDPSILDPLLGKSSKTGRSIALQATKPFYVNGSVFEDLIGEGKGKGLKVYSEGEWGGGILGVWNVRSGEGEVEDELVFDDILSLTSPSPERTTYAIHSFKTGSVYVADTTSSSLVPSRAPISLEPFGFDIFTIVPFLSSTHCSIACLGLTSKFNPLAALVTPASFVEDSPSTFSATFKCVGTASFVLQRLAGAGAGEAGASVVKVSVGGTAVSESCLTRRWAGEKVGEVVSVDFEGLLRDQPSAGGDEYEVALEVL